VCYDRAVNLVRDFVTGAAIALVLALAVVGGGYELYVHWPSGGSAPLHLASGDVSESDYRFSIRVALVNPLTAALCPSIQGLSGQDAFMILADSEVKDIAAVAVGNPEISTVEAAQTQVNAIATFALSSDAGRAGRIIQEECARIK
jgi:hypothetical protein